MTKIYLTMSHDEWLQLSRTAEQECRHPRDHARYLLRRALGMGGEQPQRVSEQTKNGAGSIHQDLASAVP